MGSSPVGWSAGPAYPRGIGVEVGGRAARFVPRASRHRRRTDQAVREHPGAVRCRLRHRARPDPRGARPQRGRQDHGGAHPHHAGATRRRPRRHRRHRRAERAPPGPGAHRPDRPIRGGRRGAHRLREPRTRRAPLPPGHRRGPDAGGRAARTVRPGRRRRPRGQGLLGRHAPATRHRHEPHRTPVGPVPRRAHHGARSPQPAVGVGPDRRARARRHHHAAHDPVPRRGRPHGIDPGPRARRTGAGRGPQARRGGHRHPRRERPGFHPRRRLLRPHRSWRRGRRGRRRDGRQRSGARNRQRRSGRRTRRGAGGRALMATTVDDILLTPADEQELPSGPAWLLRDSWTEALRHLRRVPRNPELLMFATIQPIMFIVLFVYVFGGAITAPGYDDYKQYLLPGIFAQTVLFNSSFTGVGIADDLSKGIIDRLRSLPMYQSAVLIGRTLSDVGRNIVTFAVMFGVAFAIGFRIEGTIVQAVGATLLLFAFSYAFSWIQALIGLSAGSVEAASSAGFIWMFPLTFVSSAFVPVETMPGWLQPIATNNPFTIVTNATRALYNGHDPGSDLWVALAWAVGITVVFAVFASRKFASATSA